jgi:hypothetical protein
VELFGFTKARTDESGGVLRAYWTMAGSREWLAVAQGFAGFVNVFYAAICSSSANHYNRGSDSDNTTRAMVTQCRVTTNDIVYGCCNNRKQLHW